MQVSFHMSRSLLTHQTLRSRGRSDRCVYIHASNQDKRLDRATLIGKLLQLDDAPSQPGIAKEPDTCGKEPCTCLKDFYKCVKSPLHARKALCMRKRAQYLRKRALYMLKRAL